MEDYVSRHHQDVLRKAEAGDADAQATLGSFFFNGVPEAGLEPYFELAARWLSKAAGAHHIQAQALLGVLYLRGNGVPQNERRAAKWLQQAADAGDAAAQSQYGALLYTGQGVDKDDARGVSYWQKAVAQDHLPAMVSLGVALHKGEGVKQNKTKALALMSAAARQGDEHAVMILAKWDLEAAAEAEKTKIEAAAEESRRRTDEFLFSTGVAGAAADKLRSLAPDHQARLRRRLVISVAAGASAADLEVMIMRADDHQYAAMASELAALDPSLRPVAKRLALTSAAVWSLSTLDSLQQEGLACRFAEPGLLADIVDLDDFIARAFATEKTFEILLRASVSFMEPDLVNYIQGLPFDLSRSCVKELRALDEQKQRGVADTLATVDLRDIDDPSAYVLECLDLSKRLDEDAAELAKKEAAAERAAAELLREEEDEAAAARAKRAKKKKAKKKRRGAATATAPDESKVEVAPAAEENKVEEEDQASLDLAQRLTLEDAPPPPPPPGKVLVDEILDDAAARAAALETSLTAHQAELKRLKAVLKERGVPDGYLCPISLEVMEDPVIAADGHSYERSDIEAWFNRGNDTSPKTGGALPHQFLTPNHNLRSAIQDFLAEVRQFADM
ncbi:unnamed protein product [Pelagomonas calceolata]|uniref:U-box domain-containing protein n=1 Tax=Pelagomonas calceolata TaxID=35677 RepID=A0A8J2SIZ4_9STRA|nr:unnamed protein product [Pelagomonas calceolata]|mmetsp:Transcript_17732/g.50651  ORF Transcript_17732/g.50651 Transcript_17732/m.50651 type:complete len:620 (-) Transcript_17732:39-1898(-)